MHNGDIYFPVFLRDKGLLFQPLLLTVCAHGMISKTMDEGKTPCSLLKTSFPL